MTLETKVRLQSKFYVKNVQFGQTLILAKKASIYSFTFVLTLFFFVLTNFEQ